MSEKGWEIKNAIKKRIGIPVSVGFGATKTIAKIANRLAKKSDKANGVLSLYESPYLPLALERTEIGDVWGIGGASAAKLKNIRIENALQFRNLDVRFVRKLLTVTGARTALELRGVKCIPLEQTTANKKNIAATRTFGNKVTQLRELKEAVAYFVSLAVEKLRKNDLSANSINVFVASDRFGEIEYYSNSASYSGIYASDLLNEIQTWAFSCLQRIFRDGIEYKRAGIMLSGLVPSSSASLRMLDDNYRLEKMKILAKTIDEINHRWGKQTVRFAVNNPAGNWQMKQTRKSQRFTTRIDEIMQIQ